MKRGRGGDRGAGADVDSHGDRSSIDDWFANQEKNAKARPLITLREKPKTATKRRDGGGCDVCGKVSSRVGAGGCAGPGRKKKKGKGYEKGYSFNWCGEKHYKQLEPRIEAAVFAAASGLAQPRNTSPGTISASGPISWKKMPLSEYERGRAGDPRQRDRVDSHASPASSSKGGPNRRRAAQLLVRLTDTERTSIMLAAGEESHNLSHWIRRTLLAAAKKNETSPDVDPLSRLKFSDDELGELQAAAEWQGLELDVWARELLLRARKTVSFE